MSISSVSKARPTLSRAEAETPAVESADEVVEPEVENINDNAESETADTTEAEAESADENNYGTRFSNSNGGVEVLIHALGNAFCRLRISGFRVRRFVALPA